MSSLKYAVLLLATFFSCPIFAVTLYNCKVTKSPTSNVYYITGNTMKTGGPEQRAPGEIFTYGDAVLALNNLTLSKVCQK